MYDPEKHHRRSIRLKDYDYAQEGAYFITICSHERKHLFGEIENSSLILNRCGDIVLHSWLRLPELYDFLELDAFIIMPNHFHGIVVLNASNANHIPIGELIRRFKAFTAREINLQRGVSVSPVWQRNFYERIIRGESMLDGIREYIENNPANWDKDDENLG